MQPLHAFLSFSLLFSIANSQASTTESAILLRLKRYLGNPPSLDRWNSTSSPCEPYSPYTSCINGSVTGIYLSGINIQGSVPSKLICQLKNLTSINFSANNLWGTIPVGLSSCSKLERLSLSANLLTGKIPGELFSIKTLRSLSLGQNMLSGEIPTPMVAYSLESLDLSYNQLTGSIPEDIGNLYNLSHLDLSWNYFSGPVPGELLSMKSLRSLSLRQNMLFGEIPTPVVAYSLESLDLSSNHLNGSISEDIGNLYNLVTLDLSMNSFSGPIPAGLLRLHKLSYLSLASNNLSGTMPKDFGKLRYLTNMAAYSLESLDLSSNHLNGSISEDLGNLYNLVTLDLSMNSFSGPIPAGLSRLHKLSYLSLASNNLSGTIPKDFGKLRYLTNMDVSDNQLSGDIWESVSHLRVQLTLRICLNHLSGRIPNKLVEERFYTDSCFDQANLWVSNSNKKLYIIITCVNAGVLIGLVILLFVFRREGERRKENDGEEWSMISFQRLEFSEREILAGLTDENLIGHGGSGKVYRVITGQGQKVAIKSISHEQKQGHRLEKQFLAEVQILGEIRHYNIVKILCCIKGKNTKLIVYEYMDKQCLNKWLHGKKKGLTFVETSTQILHWERRLKIAVGVAQGLCYMHHGCNPPIVHRDIKSSNILLDSEFNAKIADFGLAKMLATQGDPETASTIVGTFGYIAPEYGSTRKVNVKSDIYSFGVVLLELTTGREAVTGDEDMNLAQWAHKHQSEGNSAVDALDEEIKDPCYLEAATTVFKLGLACTLRSPSWRPSMKCVVQILQSCSENNHSSSGS